MIGLLRSELLKIRSVRSNLIMAVAAVVMPLGSVVLVSMLTGLENVDNTTISSVLAAAAPVSVLLYGIVGVLCMAQEYSQSTIRLTLAATPNRYAAYFAKLLVIAIISALFMGISTVGGTVAGKSILSTRGFTGELTHPQVSASLAAMIVIAAMAGVLGVGLGAITRNPPGAITVLLLWPLLVEILVGNIVAQVFSRNILDWLPFGTAIQAMFLDVEGLRFGRWGATGYFGIWVMVLVVIGQAIFTRRDA
jgi:ABC-type transport system involved in multi-copper enzyme maturation permease subunit